MKLLPRGSGRLRAEIGVRNLARRKRVRRILKPLTTGDALAPVPVRAIDRGLPVALSETVSVAERLPRALGVKATSTGQDARTFSVRCEHPSATIRNSEAWGPLTATVPTRRKPVPVSVSVARWVALVPSGRVAKASVDGPSAAAGTLFTLSRTETLFELLPVATSASPSPLRSDTTTAAGLVAPSATGE